MAALDNARRARASAADLAAPPSVLGGVGPTRAARLAALGVHTLRDLLCTLPTHLQQWPATCSLAAARADRSPAPRVVKGRVLRWRFARFRGRSSLRCTIADASGELEVVFFNQPWLRQRLAAGEELEVLVRPGAKPDAPLVASRLGFADTPLPRAGALEATYPSAAGVSSAFVRALIARALERFGEQLHEDLAPAELERRGLMPLPGAVRAVHAPRSLHEYELARRRVALEPLIATQRRLLASREAARAGGARALSVSDASFAALVARFPFELTRGQREIAAQLRSELSASSPMRRLLQGDVGSGKTVLGALACAIAAKAGAQAAFMAPTELLAEQHFTSLRELLESAGVRCGVLSGSTGARERRALLAGLASGELGVVFGTHALFSQGVEFARLALAVVDEQQRFGVAQRERLFDKGRGVHGLLMTATPIPRSLALTLYGDLDVSILREKPPGRSAVLTRWVREDKNGFEHELEQRLARGEQLYWVVPRIDTQTAGEDDDGAILGAQERFERIAARRWSRFGVELVHGRLASPERAAALERFRCGAARILVATTVIEVGVDVPSASAIVIEHCERLGLAQLHQLRGRVGRGAAPSVCLLLGRTSARKRLELLERSDDGFAIAEADLALRGMGDLTGLRQAGENREGLEDPALDVELIVLARDLAQAQQAGAPAAECAARLS